MHRTKVIRFSVILPLIAAAVWAVSSALPVSASTVQVTKKASYASFYSDSTLDTNATSPCSKSGCANGIRYTWAASSCYENDRYPPIAVVWTAKGQVSTTAWPLTAPCSSGIQFSWDKYDQIDGAKWLGATSQETQEGLAICFQYKNQCNAGHCVTAGCLPQHTTGADIFFQGGDVPTEAAWMVNGKVKNQIAISGAPNNVFWYGYAPPASPFATSATTSSAVTPTVKLTGRNSAGDPQYTTNVAPTTANAIDMSWYLPKYDPADSRGCHEVNGRYWTSPPLAFAYTDGGKLSGRITVPGCPDVSGQPPQTYPDIMFSFRNGSSGVQLTGAQAFYDQVWNQGCQTSPSPALSGYPAMPSVDPKDGIPQPPAGSNGLVFTFSHDDYKAACWRHNGSVLSPAISHPGHPRLAVLGS